MAVLIQESTEDMKTARDEIKETVSELEEEYPGNDDPGLTKLEEQLEIFKTDFEKKARL